MNELIYWIWLSISVTPDTPTFKKLIDVFSDAKAIYDADIYDISKCIGSRTSDRSKLADKDLDRACEIYAFCKKHDVGILAYPDEYFPESLREIKNPPVLLYYRGALPDFNKRFFISIVGTRLLSDYGRCAAFTAAYEMSLAGAVVVSGMAMGIDGVAHAGALAADGVTVAVIGSGINVCFPKEHQTLAREIVKRGCVLTEFPPNTPPSRTTFPKRNRIISALSAATLVIEGKEKSGSLITARCAKEQGRLVYALPGNVGTKNSEATNLLIKNGAKLYTSSDDVIRDFEISYPGELNPFLLPERVSLDVMDALRRYAVCAVAPNDEIFIPPRNKIAEVHEEIPKTEATAESVTLPDSFDKNALSLYKMIPFGEECLIDSLANEEMNMRTVMQCLLKLEMGGFVEICPGERVRRKLK